MDQQPLPEPDEQQQHELIASHLAQTGLALPGTVVTRHMRCGKARCRCKADPPQLHGPYYQWTRKVEGKTITRWLTDEQLARYQAWFANAQRLRDLLTELEALSLRIAERTEGWEPQPLPTGHRPRRTVS
jgi:hypothetical protein